MYAAYRLADCAVLSLPLFDILLLHLMAGPVKSHQLHDLLRHLIYEEPSTPDAPPA